MFRGRIAIALPTFRVFFLPQEEGNSRLRVSSILNCIYLLQDPNLAEELQFKLQQVTSNLEQAVAERDEANHKLHQQYKNNENLARYHK